MRSPHGAVTAACLFAFALAASPAWAADYGLAGPHPVTLVQLDEPDGLRGALAVPTDAADATPVVLVAHGFASSSQRMFGWGEHLASHGFVALAFDNCVGDLLCGPDPAAQADLASRALAFLDGERAPAAIRGKVATGRVAFLGHSAGGQAMAVAAKALRPQGLVLFDPVGGDQAPESTEPAASALAATCTTTLTLFAEPHTPDAASGTPSCNKNGSWRPLVSAGPRASAVVAGSTHCDGELPPRIACGYSCGGRAGEARQLVYKRYAAAFALAVLRDDDAAARSLTSGLVGDPGLREGLVVDGTSCEGKGFPGIDTAGAAGAPGAPATTQAAAASPDDGCTARAPGSDGSGAFSLGLAASICAATWRLGRRRPAFGRSKR